MLRFEGESRSAHVHSEAVRDGLGDGAAVGVRAGAELAADHRLHDLDHGVVVTAGQLVVSSRPLDEESVDVHRHAAVRSEDDAVDSREVLV